MKTLRRHLLLFAAALAAGAAEIPAPAPAEATAPETASPPVPAAAKPKKSPAPALAAKAAVAPAPPPLSPRFQQVRDRIDALFRHRSETPPAPDPRKNPFRPAGAAPVALAAPGSAASSQLPPVEPNTDAQLLQQGAATLKVAGTIQIGGLAHLIINQVPYKEGEIINTRVRGQPVYLRLKNISRYSYTLSLNAAELSVKY